jgi:2-aminoadipate transaminase
MPGFRYSPSAGGSGPARLREILGRASRPGVISFAIGMPAAELLPARQLAAAQQQVLPGNTAALQYGLPSVALKRQIVELMAERQVACGEDQVFLTSGAQQGMDLVARLFLGPGDTALMEDTVYDGIRLAAGRLTERLITVPTDTAAGIDVDAVASCLAAGAQPRLLYTIPNGHNPLGVTLSAARRQQLIALARRHELPVLEDDAYGALHYDGAPPPPLRALDPDWALYLGSFSKILAPSLRAGWLVVPEEMVSRLSPLKHGADLDTPSLSHHVVSAYLAAGHLAEHVARLRAEYRTRRDTMLACLAEHLPGELRWTRPGGGMFIWVELPPALDAADLLEEAIAGERVAFCPGAAFAVGESARARHGFRLCFATCTPEQIADGIHRLGRAVERALERVGVL